MKIEMQQTRKLKYTIGRRLLCLTMFFSALNWTSCMDCNDCPSPPQELRFQVVNILGQDLTRGMRARYSNLDVSLDYMQGGVEISTRLELDTLQDDKTIFRAPEVPKLVGNGITRFHLYLSTGADADTLKTNTTQIETYCCSYSVFDYLQVNADYAELSEQDSFVFFVQK